MSGRAKKRNRPYGWSDSIVLFQMRNEPISLAFWLLALLFLVAFAAGGSSKPEAQSVVLLRPFSVLMAGYGLATMTKIEFQRHRVLYFFAAAVALLVAIQLIPLPPDLWTNLPGRQLVIDIEARAGLANIWRPISLDPEGTWNALWSLALPVAVLVLATRMSGSDHIRLLFVVAFLISLSGIIGMCQASGFDIQLYDQSGGASGLLANRNHQAVLMAILLLLISLIVSILPQPRRHQGRVELVALVALVIPVFALLIVTGSRSGFLLAVFAVVLIPILRILSSSGSGLLEVLSGTKGYGVILSVVGLLALMVAIAAYTSRDIALSRLADTYDDLRWPVWQEVWKLVGRFWPVGSGFGSYVSVFQVYEPNAHLRPTYSNHAHNDYLEVIMTGGVSGLFLLFSALAFFGLATKNAWKGSDEVSRFRRTGLGMFLIFALASTVDYPGRVPAISALWMLACVWSFASWKIASSRSRPYETPDNGGPRRLLSIRKVLSRFEVVKRTKKRNTRSDVWRAG